MSGDLLPVEGGDGVLGSLRGLEDREAKPGPAKDMIGEQEGGKREARKTHLDRSAGAGVNSGRQRVNRRGGKEDKKKRKDGNTK